MLHAGIIQGVIYKLWWICFQHIHLYNTRFWWNTLAWGYATAYEDKHRTSPVNHHWSDLYIQINLVKVYGTTSMHKKSSTQPDLKWSHFICKDSISTQGGKIESYCMVFSHLALKLSDLRSNIFGTYERLLVDAIKKKLWKPIGTPYTDEQYRKQRKRLDQCKPTECVRS